MIETDVITCQELNLTPLLGADKYAVACKTEYEAQCLLYSLKSNIQTSVDIGIFLVFIGRRNLGSISCTTQISIMLIISVSVGAI